MKTLKILFAAIIFAGLFSVAYASDTPVEASATVLAELTVTRQQNVNFGNVAQGITANMNPENGSTVDAGASALFGRLFIEGAANTDVFISHPDEVTLTRDGGPETMIYTPKLAFGFTTTVEGDEITQAGSAHELDGDGNAYVHIGGDLVVDAAQATGLYEGTFNVTVVYN